MKKREVKYYVPGCESEKRVDLLLQLTSIRSVNMIKAIKDVLTKGWPDEDSAELNGVDLSNLKRGIRKVNRVIKIHNDLMENR